jgi:hypothetical protein
MSNANALNTLANNCQILFGTNDANGVAKCKRALLIETYDALIGLDESKALLERHVIPFQRTKDNAEDDTMMRALAPRPHCYCLYGRKGSGKKTLVDMFARHWATLRSENRPDTEFVLRINPYNITPDSLKALFSVLEALVDQHVIVAFESCQYAFTREEHPNVQTFMLLYSQLLERHPNHSVLFFFLVDDTPKSLCMAIRRLLFIDIEVVPLTGDERRKYLTLVLDSYYATQEVLRVKVDDAATPAPVMWYKAVPDDLETLVDASEYCTPRELLGFCQRIFYTDAIEKRDPFTHTFSEHIQPLLHKERMAEGADDGVTAWTVRLTPYVPKELYIPIKQYREGGVDMADVDEINKRTKGGKTSERVGEKRKQRRAETMDLSMAAPSAIVQAKRQKKEQ